DEHDSIALDVAGVRVDTVLPAKLVQYDVRPDPAGDLTVGLQWGAQPVNGVGHRHPDHHVNRAAVVGPLERDAVVGPSPWVAERVVDDVGHGRGVQSRRALYLDAVPVERSGADRLRTAGCDEPRLPLTRQLRHRLS